MPIGAPDWSNVRRPDLTKINQDLNELAARLGSPSIIERGGEVIYLTDFSRGIQSLDMVTNGLPDYIELTPIYFELGQWSMRMHGALASGLDVKWNHVLPLISTRFVGFEIGVAFGTGHDTVDLILEVFDGTTKYYLGVRISLQTNGIALYKSGIGWDGIRTLTGILSGYSVFHFVKVIIDIESNKYMFLFIDGIQIDISQYFGQSSVSGIAPSIKCSIVTFGNQTGDVDIIIDRVIITRNEQY